MDASWIEQIEAHLAGQISRSELEQYATTQGISDVDENIRWVKEAQTAVAMQALRQQLKNTIPPPRQSAQVRRMTPISKLMAIAAGLLLLVFFYAVYFQMETPSDLYADFSFQDPGIPIQMSQSPNYQLLNALTYFGEGDYEETIKIMSELRVDRPANDTINYFLGASLLYEKQPAQARVILEQVRSTENERFSDRGEWLYVLTFLSEEDYSEVRTALAPILADSQHDFFVQAQALADALPQ